MELSQLPDRGGASKERPPARADHQPGLLLDLPGAARGDLDEGRDPAGGGQFRGPEAAQ